jgi:hypothetical protein
MKSFRFAVAAVALVTASACGPAGEEFHGTYSANGTIGYTLNGRSSTSPFTDALMVGEGTDSDIVITWGKCFYAANIQGETATVRSGTTCTQNDVVDGEPVTSTLTVTTGTLTRNGTVTTLNFAGTASVVYGGQTFPGTYTATGTLNRVAR